MRDGSVQPLDARNGGSRPGVLARSPKGGVLAEKGVRSSCSRVCSSPSAAGSHVVPARCGTD